LWTWSGSLFLRFSIFGKENLCLKQKTNSTR
jgi:hypothetical protein